MKQNAKRRDMLADALQELEALVHQNPDLECHQLLGLVKQQCPLSLEWIDAKLDMARLAALRGLLRLSKATLPDGRHVRLILTYRKFIQTETGKEKQLHLWKHAADMTADEFSDSLSALKSNIKGGIEQYNSLVEWRRQQFPAEEPSKQLRLI